MTDRLDELTVFIAVVETGSLRGAATRLRRSPASITRAIAQLEDRLARRLIERTTRRLAVTDAGRETYAKALEMTEAWRLLAAPPLSGTVRGLVRLTAPVVFGQTYVAPALDTFLGKWPEATAELILDDRYLDFIENGLDVAVRLGNLPDSSLVAQRVGATRWILIASPAYLAAHGMPSKPADLATHATIVESALTGRSSWEFATRTGTETVPLQPRLMSNDIEVQLQAVRAGRGIARMLTYQAARDLEAGSLIRLLPDFEPADIPIQIVTAGGRHPGLNARALASHLAEALRATLPKSGPTRRR